MLPELHPDELLSREASSTLTPREWEDLSAHLARCPACALERAVRREAARARVPSNDDHAIAARVVGRLLAEQPGVERPRAAAKRAGGASRGRRLAYAALVLVLVSGTAMAGVALVAQVRHRATVEDPPSRQDTSPHRRRGAPVARAQAANAERVPPPASEPAPATTDAQPGQSKLALASLAADATSRAPGRTRLLGRRRLASTAAERAGGGPSALLGRAEAAEASGRLAEASRLYGELGRRFSGTREEIVGRALHGQLLLDRLVTPTRALALFEGYLDAEPAGTLAEEARLGRARAFERLGRSREERAAWLELLRAHPRSVHAAAARGRLASLDRL